MRNNSGAAILDGRSVRWGLMNDSPALNARIKSSDLIGWTTVTVTPDMVGQRLAVFTAVEVKDGSFKGTPRNDRERAQEAFLKYVRDGGGLAAFAASEGDYLGLVKR